MISHDLPDVPQAEAARQKEHFRQEMARQGRPLPGAAGTQPVAAAAPADARAWHGAEPPHDDKTMKLIAQVGRGNEAKLAGSLVGSNGSSPGGASGLMAGSANGHGRANGHFGVDFGANGHSFSGSSPEHSLTQHSTTRRKHKKRSASNGHSVHGEHPGKCRPRAPTEDSPERLQA